MSDFLVSLFVATGTSRQHKWKTTFWNLSSFTLFLCLKC